VKGPVYWLGWIATAAMAFCIAGMGISFKQAAANPHFRPLLR